MNSKGHFYTSILKSIIRIGSCGIAYLTESVPVLAFGFLIAEILGIIEEVFDER